MSLYGALFSGVSGLKSQANKLGVISDNVSNVNTVGYKGGNGLFETLVTSSSATAAYSPGGVLGGNRLLVSKQGLLQATDSPTDIAISGNGFFVVNQNSTGDGQVGYTRSGSFRADSTGNFRNASGFYLQAWPLDREGRLPGAAGNTTYTTSSANLGSLKTVNVQNLTGSAAATSSVSIGANLNASQSIFAGASGTIDMDALSSSNFGIKAKDIIVPSSVNSIARGDKMTIAADGTNYTYRYGGFTFSRSVSDGTSPDSGATQLAGTTTLGSNPLAFTAGSNVVTVTHTDHGLVDGAVVTISGNNNDAAGISSSNLNGRFVVNVINANTYTYTAGSSASAARSITTNSISTSSGSNATVTIDVGTAGLFSVGQSITVAGANAVNGVTVNGTHTITAVSGTTVTWASTTTTPPAITTAHAFTSTTGADPTVTVNLASTGNTYAVGQSITIAGASSFNGVDPNGTWTVSAVSGNNVSYVATGETAAAVSYTNANPVTLSAAGVNPTVTLDLGVAATNYAVGQSITVASVGTVNGLAIDGTYTVTAVSGNTVSFVGSGTSSATTAGGSSPFTVLSNTGGGAASTGTVFLATGGGASATVETVAGGGSTISSVTRPFSGSILNAINSETTFLPATGNLSATNFTDAGLSFTITTAAIGTATFQYTSSSPDVRQKQFNSLSTLASAINEVTGLSARVVNNRLYVGATDATAAVTFANGSLVGTEGPPVQAGIDWVRELGLNNINQAAGRFSSMEGLYKLAVADTGLSASLENPLGAAKLSINVDDPLATITFADSVTLGAFAASTNATPFTTVSGSKEISVAVPVGHEITVGDFVDLNAATLADTQTIATSNPFTTTSGANSTVTVDISSSGQTYIVGQLITIAGATSVNGVTVNGTHIVTAVSGNDVSFATTQTASATTAGGGSAGTVSYGSFNGVPLADFSGRFEVVAQTSTTISVNVATAATAGGPIGETGLVVTPHNNRGSLLAELGLVTSLNSATYTPQATAAFGPAYDPRDSALNMASGNVASQFSRPIRIYDAQGGGHDLNVAFLKTDINKWAVEVFAVPKTDISSSLPDGLIAYGGLEFNGDGTLRNVENTLSQAASIIWTNGAKASAVSFDWGTAGQPFGTTGATVFGAADGLSQFNAAYKVSFANQNGAPVGELTGVSITELGVVVASYNNGQTQSLYKIPLADFANPDQLSSSSGNVFTQSADSGEFNLRQAGTSGVGKLAASSLEASNVELSAELTDMIIAQRSYQANAKVISTSDNMLEELNRIIQ